MVSDQHWVMSLRRLGSMWQVPLSCSLSPEVGQPDFAPPPEAIKATAEAAVQGLTSYTGVSGLAFCPVWTWQKCQLLCGDMQCPTPAGTLELRTAISEYLEKYKKVPAIHESLGPEAQRCMSHWLTALNILITRDSTGSAQEWKGHVLMSCPGHILLRWTISGLWRQWIVWCTQHLRKLFLPRDSRSLHRQASNLSGYDDPLPRRRRGHCASAVLDIVSSFFGPRISVG